MLAKRREELDLVEAEFKPRIASKQQQLEDEVRAVGILQASRGQLVVAIAAYEATITELTATRATLQGNIAELTALEDNVATVTSDLVALQTTKATLETDIAAALVTQATAVAQSERLERAATDKQAAREATVADLQHQVDVLEAKRTQLDNVVLDKRQEYNQFNAAMETERSDLAKRQLALDDRDKNLRIREIKVEQGEAKIQTNASLLNL